MTDRSIRAKLERRFARYLVREPLALKGDRAWVTFSFDDVPKSACTEGRDILERHGARGTYYVCGGLTDRPGSLGAPMHSRDDLIELLERGHEVACHGFGHLNYQEVPAQALIADIEHNRQFLRELGAPAVEAPNFAYPFGCVSPAVKRLVGRHYRSARGINSGGQQGHTDRLLLKSSALYQQLWTESSLAQAIDSNAAQKGWLTFFTHGVDPKPDEFSCTPALLEFAVQRAVDSGARIMTVDQALNALGPVRA